jgi:molybdopterin adenylyltransferase
MSHPSDDQTLSVLRVGRVTLSDRASAGLYADESGPEIERVIRENMDTAIDWIRVLLPDEEDLIMKALVELADTKGCHLILTTGGTGPSERDLTPEATKRVINKELPGFGEIMRLKNFDQVPTSILSRATAGVRGRSLIINLPGRPTAIAECLPSLVPAIREAMRHLRQNKIV